jgi:lipopolysaccharide transport system ATP-binding protein
MSSETIIEVRKLWKSFPVYDKAHYRLMQMVFRTGRKWYREFVALKGVDFVIHRGETVGIVGRNGSGKSTLLQIICGTLSPSAGSVQVRGRVAALLELGAGFNPEFTGRENVYLYGTVLGLTKRQVDEKLATILTFAEIGDFIDRPVKTYSSGMYVRLAFAVAINVDPDLLVVDEALSVGDEAFQRKCFARIEHMRKKGCTILFVSHAASTIVELCDRAILIDHGEVLADGVPKAVIARYQRMLYAPPEHVPELREQMKRERSGEVLPEHSDLISRSDHIEVSASPPVEGTAYLDESLRTLDVVTYPNQGAVIIDPHLETSDGTRVNVLYAGERYAYRYRVRFDRGAASVRFGMLLKTATGVEIAGAASSTLQKAIGWVDVGTVLDVRFEFDCALAGGAFFLNAGVLGMLGEEETYLDRRVDVLMFRVIASPERLATGLVDLIDVVKVEAVRETAIST